MAPDQGQPALLPGAPDVRRVAQPGRVLGAAPESYPFLFLQVVLCRSWRFNQPGWPGWG